MQFQKSLMTVGAVLAASVMLAGCTASKTPATPGSESNGGAMMKKVDEKKGDTTLSGVITASGENYTLAATGKAPQGIDSYSVDLKQYVGKTVKVTGQFSGDTLFVSKIE